MDTKPCCSNANCHTPGVVKDGRYFRARDGRWVQRYRCMACRTRFSDATVNRNFRQHKPWLNHLIFKLLCSLVSQRRICRLLRCNRKTVARKLVVLAYWARIDEASDQLKLPPVTAIHFDDMESFEHTKLKPLSIPLAVSHDSRRILAWSVASMPAKGPMAKLSVKKYGKRQDERPRAWNEVFSTLSTLAANGVIIRTDMHLSYRQYIKKHLPTAQHYPSKSRKACVAGQGELKKGGFDPLFSINHTAAMLRSSINRLIRRTWCTTKKASALANHIALYVRYHNTELI